MAICHFLQKSKQILTPILYPSFESQASLSYNWKKKVFPLFSFGLGFGDGEGDSGDVTVRRFRWWECQTVWASWGRGRACVRGGEAAAATKHEARVFFCLVEN
ncbi:hypothetical protein ES332_D11G031000v1 [Gossypium tomentosum]|uniref:Uncharacterized protein n=1 Tax=Gossypium tomentosum TaxID=34277 RepID=A0A5D2IIA1_GOSTO|nr:hypothetical protein ES332_D11G031000v1 [Gossypium tomentosum]